MKKLILFLVICSSCKKHDPAQTPIVCDPAISYSQQVHAIFVANCTAAGCHDGGILPSLGDYLTARDAASQIRDAVNRNIMPKNSTLSATDKAAILCWIDSGAKNN